MKYRFTSLKLNRIFEKNPLRLWVFIFICISAFLGACQDTDERLLIVQTGEVSELRAYSINIEGIVADLNQEKVLEYGHCYSLNPNPTLADSVKRINLPFQRGIFNHTIEGLAPEKNYYFRAFVKTQSNIYYGNVLRVKTLNPIGTWEKINTFPDEDKRAESSPLKDPDYTFVVQDKTYYRSIVSISDFQSTAAMFRNSFLTIDSPWEQIPLLAERCPCTGFTIGTRHYIVSNSNNSRVLSFLFDPNSTLTQSIKPYPGEQGQEVIQDFFIRRFNSFIAFSIGAKGYMGMGSTGIGNVVELPSTYTYFKDFYSYDPNTNVWTRIADFPGEARRGSFAFSINGKAYIGLGQDETNFFKDVWEYDPIANLWTRKADFPGIARSFPAFFVIGDYAYIGAGGQNSASTYQRDFWQYNPRQDKWNRVADLPSESRKNPQSFALNGKGYVMNGSTSTISSNVAFDAYRFIP